MALKFNIKSTQDCGKLKYTNCSTYCSPDNYLITSLIASVVPGSIAFFGSTTMQVTLDILNTTEFDIDTVEWEINNSGNIINTLPNVTNVTINSPDFISQNVNIITLTVTNTNGDSSVLTFAVRTGENNTLEWLAIPDYSITTGNTLEVAYNNASLTTNGTLVNTTIDPSSIIFDPDGSSNFDSVQNFTYTSDGEYNVLYRFSESEDNTQVELVGYIKIEEDPTDCTNQLTTSDIDSVVLTATSPKGTTYTLDITDNFTTLTTFDVLASNFGSFSTFESGIWTFQTIVTKVTNTGTFIFADTIKLVIICKEECSFNAYVATYAEEELDCCTSCKEEKEKKIILMSTYIDAIKNASACGELTKITKFINLLQRLLSNKNCSC
jgi:hypothetical protein